MKSKPSSLSKALSPLKSATNKWAAYLLAAGVCALAFQKSLLLYEASWGRGFLNPYTSISLTLSEGLFFLTAILFFIQSLWNRKRIQYGDPGFFLVLLTGLIIACVSLFLSPTPDSAFHFLLFIKLFSLLLFYLLLVNPILNANRLLQIFIHVMSFQAALALLQVLLQQSLGLHFLGEPILSDQMPHIARFVLAGQDIIRGYGTFPHPNVLGGFLVISLIASLLFIPRLKHQKNLLILLQFFGLLASFSRTAMLAFMIALIMISIWHLNEIRKNKFIPIALFVLFFIELSFLGISRGFNLHKDPAFLERLEGFKLSLEMFQAHPMGVGFSHYTLHMDSLSEAVLLPWQYQPVHNVFLLALSEAGLLGMLGMLGTALFIFSRIHSRRKTLLTPKRNFNKRILFTLFLALFVISLFDHYLMSLDQGRLLFIFVFALASRFAVNPSEILPLKKEGLRKKIPAAQ